jgi:hypothetical protein
MGTSARSKQHQATPQLLRAAVYKEVSSCPSLLNDHRHFVETMANEHQEDALGSIQLSYEDPLLDEHLEDLENMIKQTGLQIHECRRYITEQPDSSTDHVVEIFANYESLSLDQWSGLVNLVKQTYFDPGFLGCVGYKFRKRL